MHQHQHDHTHHNSIFHKMGMSLSVACSIHCLAMPFVIAFLPTASAVLDNIFIEAALIGSSLLLAGYTFVRDFRRTHNHALPLILLGIGFLLILSAFLPGAPHQLSLLGGVVLFSGYAANWYMARRYASCRH